PQLLGGDLERSRELCAGGVDVRGGACQRIEVAAPRAERPRCLRAPPGERFQVSVQQREPVARQRGNAQYVETVVAKLPGGLAGQVALVQHEGERRIGAELAARGLDGGGESVAAVH